MNNTYLVEERSRDIGDFLVGRLLPFRKKRQVGPFTFIDHMGPEEMGGDSFMDVDQHPHIGLCTLTYLLEGEIEHRDSIGTVQLIQPGDVGFMTAGKGVTHTERTPKTMRTGATFKMHGYQIWVALPKELEETHPSFQHIPAKELPRIENQGWNVKLVAGSGFCLKSPLNVYSPCFMADLHASANVDLDLSNELEGEIAIVVVEGKVQSKEHSIEAGQMLISKSEDECRVHLYAGTRVLLFGGEPLPETRYLMWNFVSSDRDRLEKARDEWIGKKFPEVPGDHTYIPYPSKSRN